MLDLTFSQIKIGKTNLLDLTFAQAAYFSGGFFDVSFSQKNAISGSVLDVSFSQFAAQTIFPFKGKHAIGIDDFDIRVIIDGKLAPICQFSDTMVIRHGENQAYTCTFTLLHPHERGHPAPINPYVYYSKNIVVEAIHASGSLKLYQGKVDKMGINPLTGRFEILCSDRREQQINALPRTVIERIGYTSIAAHGNSFETQADELAKRLETVPASFEFDANGTPYLTPWREKEAADFHITPCMIYQTEPRVELASVGGVLNEVSYTVRLQLPRILQRKINYYYDSGLNVCLYSRYRDLADIHEIHEAVEQAGWTLGEFNFERVEPSGWYNCGGRLRMGWIRDGVEEELDENGNVISRTRTFDKTVRNGTFSVYKRWQQTAAETYTITLKNSGSIQVFELDKEKLHFDISQERKDAEDWDDSFNPHEKGLQYEESRNYFTSKPFSVFPKWTNATFQAAPNGDIIAHVNLNDDGNATLRVAFWTAYTKMLASHRNNTVDFNLKFLPQIDLRHTHQITHSHFSGKCKVAAFEHKFNFRQKRGVTNVQYRFFQNPAAPHYGDLTEQPTLNRLQWRYPIYQKNYALGRVELPKEGEVGDNQGMIYRLATVNNYGVSLFNPVVFRVKTPEIEPESTDSIEQTAAQTHEVAIYHTPVEIRV